MVVPLNVVYPAFLQPYVTGIFLVPLGITALAAEILAFQRFNPKAPVGRLAAVVVIANLASSVLGVLLAFQLPDQLTWIEDVNGHRYPEPGPHFLFAQVLSFPALCLVSVAVEFFALKPVRGWAGLRNLLPAAVVANLASYLLLALGTFLF